MKKSDIAGIGFFFSFLLLNVSYEYMHTKTESTTEMIIGTVLIISSHILYIICIKNMKFTGDKI